MNMMLRFIRVRGINAVGLQIKINLSVIAVAGFQGKVNTLGPSECWFIANGALNAFYAIKNDLMTTVKNQSPALRRAVDRWYTEARDSEILRKTVQMRNELGHQAAFQAKAFLEWEDDPLNDTAIPKVRTEMRVGKGANSTPLSPDQFLSLAEEAFDWWALQFKVIADFYELEGGDRHDLFKRVAFGHKDAF